MRNFLKSYGYLLILIWVTSCVYAPPIVTNRPETSIAATITAQVSGIQVKILSQEEQVKLLASPCPKNILGSSTFDSYASYLYATYDISIHTESQSVNSTRLVNPFLEFYQPTCKEVFDTIARQTRSSWSYTESLGFWVFNPPANELTYTIEIAADWKADDQGLYVSYRPLIAPVGMDIYMLGCYTIEKDDNATITQIRETQAVIMAQPITADISVQKMRSERVDGEEALYYETPINDRIWRQWVFVKNNCVYAIVSAISQENNEVLLPDVEIMVESFRAPITK